MGVFTGVPNLDLIEKESKDGVTIEVYEHKSLAGNSVAEAAGLFYAQKAGVRLRQCVVTLDGKMGVQLSNGAMSFMLGNISMDTNVKGVGDLVSKMFQGAVTKEQFIKPMYRGQGQIALEPSYRHYLIAELNNESYCMDDGLFYASSEGVKIGVKAPSSFSSGLAGGESFFRLNAAGTGLLLLESKVPMNEVVVVELNNDVLKVDGNFAILWSDSLSFTVERSGKSLIGSAVSGEGLVNVYRGTGVVWLAPTLSRSV